MKTYNVLLGCTVQAYTEVLIQAKSAKDAEQKAKKKLSTYADELIFIVDWDTADEHRIVEESTTEEKGPQP